MPPPIPRNGTGFIAKRDEYRKHRLLNVFSVVNKLQKKIINRKSYDSQKVLKKSKVTFWWKLK